MKRVLYRVVIFLAILSLLFGGCSLKLTRQMAGETSNTASGAGEDSELDQGTVFMWEVRAREGEGKLYLLGSIHAGSDDMYPLNPIITEAFENSDILAIECDATTILQRPDYLKLMEKLMYTDGSTLKDHLPRDLFEKTGAFLGKRGLPIEFFSLYKPIFLAQNITNLLLEEWGYSPDKGIDVYFINLAKERGMEILEIESVEFQLDMLGGFSEEIQVMELRRFLEESEASRSMVEDMFRYWTEGDVKAFEELMTLEDGSLSPEEEELYREYEKIMFDDRNLHMADKAEEYLEYGKTVFYIVGAGHMVGETGIVRLLRDRGYTVVQK